MFKTKHDAKGQVERYKAILVAKGYNQREGIDFKETLSPVSTKDSLRIIMAIVALFNLELHRMDVRTTFLNRDLVEDVYMSQPIGFEEVKEHMVCVTPQPRGPIDNPSTLGNLWISGAPISHSHVSFIKTHSCIFNSQYTKIYDRL